MNTGLAVHWTFSGTSGILLTALIANIPQLILSLLFLTHNGLDTCMLLAEEWNGYPHQRKPLGVTNPTGDQRSKYRLQLPYRYSIPLMITSTLLHWLVSESLFLARVNLYTRTGQADPSNSFSIVAYSCIPTLITIIIGGIVVFVGLFNGFRRHKPGTPLLVAAVLPSAPLAIRRQRTTMLLRSL